MTSVSQAVCKIALEPCGSLIFIDMESYVPLSYSFTQQAFTDG